MEGSTIKSRIRNLLRSPSIKLKRNRRAVKENLSSKVTLERVIGITTSGSSGLTCDPCSGTVAYPAGCVVVLLNPGKNRQQHLINTSRKTITTLAFSSDGKYLVTGESGHLPAVRIWDVAEGSQVAELQEHKYGVACVAFSPNSKYIVSVGYQHDMSVNVWAWRKNLLVAANKVSSKVTAVSFSEDSSYFVTAGNRHVRFWYLDPCNSNKLSAPVPLLGRSGLLGELQNNFFCDVACGQGEKSESTFCITSSGLLCEFNEKRMLDKWVDLRTSTACALSLTEELIFCACADGTVRVFSPVDLHFICTLPRPHHLGTDVAAVTQASHLLSNKPDERYPDSVAVTYDPVNLWLSCVYNDHSLYVWDVRDLQRVGKLHSALYHSACVWDLQIYPKSKDGPPTGLDSSGLFFSCSADNTVRMWSTEVQIPTNGNVLSSDLRKVIYIDNNTAALLDTAINGAEKSEGQTAESRMGIKTICVSADGKHLASGDRTGTLRIHDLSNMEEILKVEAHDSEILCLEYSKPETGMKLLATAGRDRLIHVLDVEEDYRLLQTLDEHSSSITAVRFTANEGKVRMISCGADKSLYFRTAHRTFRGVKFKRTHHVVRKSTLYDMDVDPTCKYAAVGCQDRSIRVFNIGSGKQKKTFKGSQAEDGSLLRVQMDPSGLYVATSCSDKNLSLFDFQTGECLAAMFGHSEIITGIKFTSDCRHLISISGDSCIFVWRLAPELTINMRERLEQLKHCQSGPTFTNSVYRRASTSSLEMHSAPSILTSSSGSEEDQEDDEDERFEDNQSSDDHEINNHMLLEEDQGASDEGNDWDSSVKFQESSSDSYAPEPSLPEAPRPRRRWSCRMGELMVKSMLELRQLDSLSTPSSPKSSSISQLCSLPAGGSSTTSLQEDTHQQQRGKKRRARPHSAWLAPASSPEPEGVVLYPELCPSTDSLSGAYQVQDEEAQCPDSHSPDSGSSMGYGSGGSSPEQDHGDDPDTVSTDEEHYIRKVETIQKFHKPESPVRESFLKEHFETLADAVNMENKPRPQGSISARFFAQGSTSRTSSLFLSKTSRKVDRGPSAEVKPLVSTVRPLHEGMDQGTSLEEKAVTNPLEQCPQLCSMPQRRKAAEVHPGRVASPKGKKSAVLLKSVSAQNLTAENRKSMTPSRLKRESRPPLPQLTIERNDSRVHLHHPSSTGSSSPQPWESPNASRHLKARSYMNPTTSFIAKVSRTASIGDGLHLGIPSGDTLPCSGPSTSPTTPYSPLLPSPSASLVGPCNQTHGGSQTPPPKSSKARVFGRSNNPVSDHSSRSTPTAILETAAIHKHSFAGTEHHHTGASFAKDHFASHSVPLKAGLDPEAVSHNPQHERPLLAVQAFTMTSENQTDQGLHRRRSSSIILASVPFHLPLHHCSTVLWPFCFTSPHSVHSCMNHCCQREHSINLDICRQAAADLCNNMKKATQLYRMVSSCSGEACTERQEMERVLTEALLLVRSELEAVPRPAPGVGTAEGGERTMALLEQYSQLLLQSVEKRLDHKI
ncbi:mitogen-activated protein kinase-binding protein 1-like isoform X2 [Pygocentrus nattereri]|uniref:mitogen-activated protein kinase-binding protein 1-like isoform X2 n=1 Tax=Pygocentrus nattereri TaxID=42514 RepID=UPI0008146F28|nr:mitogen-activated protein kinase-binding protein 1-like isoform X2 [Pygocentrus nattereri]